MMMTTVALHSPTVLNYPNPNLSLSLKNRNNKNNTTTALCSSSSASLLPLRSSPKALGIGLFSLNGPRKLFNSPLVVSFAASSPQEEDKHSEVETDKVKDDRGLRADDAEEAWKQVLDTFKEQAVKMQSISEEAYEVYSKKAMIILQGTSEQLKIQADKARHDLSIIAKDITEQGVEYLSEAAENSPEPVKEVVETFTSSTDNLKDISKVHDFYFGVPYGLLLFVGGFLSFMFTGSITAIRFGMILGGALLALSISSLRSYKRGESDALALRGQTVIAGVIFLRQLRLLLQGSTILGYFNTFISGAMVAFYVYRIMLNRKAKDSNLEPETEN